VCSCPAHRDLVDCECQCDHTHDRLAQWHDRALAAEDKLERMTAKASDHIGDLIRQRDEALAEVARLRAGEDATSRDPGCQPTPGQWIRRFNDASTEERLTMARIVLDNSDRAARCFQMDHEGRLEWAEFTSTRGWWNWPVVQWWWWKQYRRRDRRAFRRECAEIQDRAARGDQ
jgi:hypothetical protein